MKIEKLNNKNLSKGILIGIIITILIFVIINFLTSRAKYRNTESINIAKGNISYSASDLDIVAMYKIEDGEDKPIEEVPGEGYQINQERSKCTIKGANGEEKDNTIEILYENNKLRINGMTKKGTKCYIYFEKGITNAQELLADLKLKSNGKKDSFTGPSSATDKGIWEAEDNDGKSYYFRGLVENNYVKFAGFTWRIIRINGDGSIRMIYAGSNPTANGSCSDCSIGSGAYNTEHDDNKYVGFRYTDADAHGTTEESDILKNTTYGLNKWYEDYIKGKDAENHIEKSAGFCNDRNATTNSSQTWDEWVKKKADSTGSSTYYGAMLRIAPGNSWGRTQTPTLKCTNNNDLFTAKNDKNKGNGALTYPIGLITADEVVFAGGFGGTASQNYYLYTGDYFWTMSPSHFIGYSANVFRVGSDGNLRSSYVYSAYGVRPVINLKADTTFSGNGNGSLGNPYVVS